MQVKSSARLSAKAIEAATERATRRAGDAAARQLRKETGDYILERKALKSGFVRPQLELRRPRQFLRWWLRVLGSPVPMERYPHRVKSTRKRRGVIAQINRGRWVPLSPRAFVALDDRIFKRVGQSRYPIKRLFSSRLTDVLQDESFAPVHLRAIFRLSLEFERIAPLELAKLTTKKSKG